MQEEWKQVKNYENYLVSNLGRVKSLNFRRSGQEGIMKLVPDRKGYFSVVLTYNAIQTPFKVHKLVAETFLPNPSHKPNVIHKDRNRSNNNVSNLEFASPSETGKYKKLPYRRLFSTSQEEKIKEEYQKAGISQAALARRLGVSQKLICTICQRN